MKYVMFSVGWEVRYNMRDEALKKIDYFVDNSVKEQGKNYFGKPICNPQVLSDEKSDEVIVIIGSTTHRDSICRQLKQLGDYEENRNVFWAPNWHGNGQLPPFYYDSNPWIYLYYKNMDYIATDYFAKRAECVYSLMDEKKKMSILDVGAGGMMIKKHLPEDSVYLPVDFIPYADETIVANLDEYEFPSLEQYGRVDYVLLGDTLVHVRDWKWLLRQSAMFSDKMIISLVSLEIMPNIRERADHGWVTHIYSHELILYMQELGYYLTKATERHNLDNIYLFEKRNER